MAMLAGIHGGHLLFALIVTLILSYIPLRKR